MILVACLFFVQIEVLASSILPRPPWSLGRVNSKILIESNQNRSLNRTFKKTLANQIIWE